MKSTEWNRKKCNSLNTYRNILLCNYEDFDFIHLIKLILMFKKFIKKIWLFLYTFWLFSYNFCVKAEELSLSNKLADDQVEKVNRRIKFIWSESWKVSDNMYIAHKNLTFRERWAAWILEVDDIMNYLVIVIQFLSQLWLVVWTIFIMFAWYKYIVSVFNWWKTASSTVKNAIIWVIIVIFSYAIMKIFTSFIWLS